MKKTVAIFFAVIFATSLVGVGLLSSFAANSRNSELDSNLAKLQEDYDALQTKYYALLGNYSYLNYDYQSVLLQNPPLVPNPGGSGVPDTQQMLTRYQALQQMYGNLQSEFNRYKENYQKLKALTDQRLMQGDLKYLITPKDPQIVNLVRNITGKVNATNPDDYPKDIKAIYNWVNDNIKYREDSLYPELPSDPEDSLFKGLQQSDQMAQWPNETLKLGMGDCEDFAALLTSMLRAYFDNRLVECIWITGANAGHVAVVIPFNGDKIVILDPIRDYYSHDTLGNTALNTISSEIYNWMNIWRPSLGNDVHVHRIFSDYIDLNFNSTEQYINWMYTR